MFLAELRAIVVLSPQLSQVNSLPCRFPSAPHAEQIFPVPLEFSSTSSTALTWHLYVRRSLMYPRKLRVSFLLPDLEYNLLLFFVTGFVITMRAGFSVLNILFISVLIKFVVLRFSFSFWLSYLRLPRLFASIFSVLWRLPLSAFCLYAVYILCRS